MIEAIEIKGYRIDTDELSHAMRIVFYKDYEKREAVAFVALRSNDAYDFASDVLHKYDILEGINDHG